MRMHLVNRTVTYIIDRHFVIRSGFLLEVLKSVQHDRLLRFPETRNELGSSNREISALGVLGHLLNRGWLLRSRALRREGLRGHVRVDIGWALGSHCARHGVLCGRSVTAVGRWHPRTDCEPTP
jgi:hypothetical protein